MARKNFTHVLVAFLMLLFCQQIYGDKLPTDGKWDDDDYRSIEHSVPELYLEESSLQIQFPQAETEVMLFILNQSGQVEEEFCIGDVEAGSEVSKDLTILTSGMYYVVLQSGNKYLDGSFRID